MAKAFASALLFACLFFFSPPSSFTPSLLHAHGFEILADKWQPVFLEDAVATSGITWVYSDFAPRSANYAERSVLPVGADECQEKCARDATCCGYTPEATKCTYYTVAAVNPNRADVDFVKIVPTEVISTYSVNRKQPESGWYVQLYLAGGILTGTPDTTLENGIYIFTLLAEETDLHITPVIKAGETLAIQAQFVVSRSGKMKRISIGSAKELRYFMLLGSVALVGFLVCLIGGVVSWERMKMRRKKRKEEREKGSP